MFVPVQGTRAAVRASSSLALAAALLAGAPLATAAQDPAPPSQAQTAAPVTLVVRDAATGQPLDAAQVVRVAPGAAPSVVARTDAAGRIAIPTAALAAHGSGDAAGVSLVFQRIGYAPRAFAASELARHIAEHAAGEHDVLLSPRPALLSAISIEAATPNQLAAGTALAVSTADRDAVARQGATSLAEALDGVEGVTTSRVGAWGSKVSVRGLGGERLAFMVDGARLNRACNFGMDQGLATIDPATVERVELLAGPGSTLYGSGNVGGVLNVVTRNPALSAPEGTVGGEVRMGAASAVPGGTAGLGVWTRRGRFDVGLQMDAQRYGDYRTPLATVAGSSYRSGTLDLKAGFAVTPAQRLALQLTGYEARDIGWPSMAGGSIPEEGRRTVALDWGWQRGRGLVDAASARGYVQRLDHHMVMDMVMPMGGGHGGHSSGGMGGGATMRSTTDAKSYSTTSGARAQLRLRPDDVTHVDAGIEATEWAAEGTRWVTTSVAGGDPATTEYHTWPSVRILDVGVFAQGERRLAERLTVSGGARADRITKRAEGWRPADQLIGTGNLGARLELGGGLGARASAGLGYRVPDPTELFGTAARPDGYVYRGNPDLSIERGRTVEAGLSWEGAIHPLLVHDMSASVTVFRNDLSDLITPSLVTGDSLGGKPIREYVNVAEARLTGVTTALAADISPAFRLSGSATFTRGVDETKDAPLAAIAPLTGTLSLRFAPDEDAGVLPRLAALRGWMEVEGRAAARQTRAATGAGELVTPGWGALALRAGATVQGLQVGVGVENLLGRSYREHLDPVSLLRPGRNFSVRLSRGF
ncbi:MAG TPA: TonB-dependent receptor [Gemmatimonadales bacterium]